MKKILIATQNPGKKKETLSCLLDITGFQFLDLKDFALECEPEEKSMSFSENAIIKAKFYAQKTGITTISEDSGFVLEAFPDKFGTRTKREIQAKDDMDWLRKFLDMLEHKKNRRAEFFSAFGIFDPHKNLIKSFVGSTKGIMAEFPAAPIEKGIPASAIFIADGQTEVYSNLSMKEKNKISHRGKAGAKMREWIIENQS